MLTGDVPNFTLKLCAFEFNYSAEKQLAKA